MKLRQIPEDFRVEELTDVKAGSQGRFAFYCLRKRNWTTHDALSAIRRRWQVAVERLSYGGLKDRHADTTQYLTILHGPQRGLRHSGIELDWLGQIERPYTSHDIRANRFQMVLRALGEPEVEFAKTALPQVLADGLANYFDDQRFGSVLGGEFVARALIDGNFERALWLALAAPYEHDRAAQKREKALLQAKWGAWAELKSELPRGHARSLVDYLVHHPTDYRGAVQRLRPDLRGLYLSAYQSHLWNRMLARWLLQHLPAEQLVTVSFQFGSAPMPCRLTEAQRGELATLQLPLPTARGQVDDSDMRMVLMNQVLADEGLTREQLKIRGLRDLFFSRGERPAWCLPGDLAFGFEDDDLNPKKQKLRLAFTLPRGCYATLLVKRITG